MRIFVAGLSYKTAPVELRERLAVDPSKLRCRGCHLKIVGDLAEVVVLSTCNRFEVYGVPAKVNGNVENLFRRLAGGEDLGACLYVKEGGEAVRHLFSVAGGLDSMVIGETEITGQVKQAYQAAQEGKLTGRITNRLFQKALQTAKEIRTRTQIGRGATSVGSVAVELAEKVFGGELPRQRVLIIGAGKMGEACVRHLAKKGVQSVLVSNRSYDRAQALAREFNGRAIRLDDCLEVMAEADIVVSSTGCPETVLDRDDLESVMRSRHQRPLVLIDIAVPRDIDPEVQHVSGVFLYDIDDLEAIVRDNVQQREQELAQCRAIIAARAQQIMGRFVGQPTQVRRPLTAAPSGGSLFEPVACCG